MVNGTRPIKAGMVLKAADLIEVTLADAKPKATAAPLPPPVIIFADNAVVVADKPAGIVTHLDAAHQTDSLSERVQAQFSLAAIGAPLRPGIVHRLDKDTSGVVILARTDAAYYGLTHAFANRSVRKEYLALLHGGQKLPDQGTIEAPIARHSLKRQQMTVSSSNSAKPAVSHFWVLERFGDTTLVRVRIETGRTHQIRVHFAAIGYPVVKDVTYGNAKLDISLEKKLGIPLPRLFLHAEKLALVLPDEIEQREFTAELPKDLAKVLKRCRGD